MSATVKSLPLRSHPGLDPGSMNTRSSEPALSVFMDPDLRQDDGVAVLV
jgi:hypothetical protein